MKRKGRTHNDVEKYKAEYGIMLATLDIPLEHIYYYGDIKEILQGHKIVFYRNGFKNAGVYEIGKNILDVHVDVESLNDPKQRPYEVTLKLNRIEDRIYYTQPKNIEHTCNETRFLEKYAHRGRAKSPCHHKIAARLATERHLREWCHKWGLEPMELDRIYPDITEEHYNAMWEIINTSGLKSVPLRRELYRYSIENQVKLYAAEIA